MPTFTNQATLSYNNTVTTSNRVQGELVETLAISKRAVGDNYRPGDAVAYVISIVNSGATPFTGLTLTDNLGAYDLNGTQRTPLTYRAGSIRRFVNGAEQTAPAVTAGPPMTITGIDVPANGNVVLVYSAESNQFAPRGRAGTIVNTATLSGASLTTPISDTESLAAVAEPELSVIKSLNPTSVAENQPLTYTFTIQNTGAAPATAADNTTITDTFAPLLTITGVNLNGAPLALNTGYTYNESTGAFATVPGVITVPAATYTQDPATGIWSTTPGVTTLEVTGVI